MLRLFCWYLAAGLSANVSAGEVALLRCASLEESADRLLCYDALAQEITARQVASQDPPIVQSTESAPAIHATSIVYPKSAQPATDSEEGFGRNSTKADEISDQIRTTITSVTLSAKGNRIMKLANGQVWMENEPGKRRIDLDQPVTITKRRWRYAMRMESGGAIVTVRRID